MTKILFRIPFTRYFLGHCRDEKYQWFSLYRKEFGRAYGSSKGYKIIDSDEYYWEEV